MTVETFYRNVLEEMGTADREKVKRATAAVFHALRDRLTVEEADQVAAQLPRPLKVVWREGEPDWRRPMKMHRRQFYERVEREAELASIREARSVTVGVFGHSRRSSPPARRRMSLPNSPRTSKKYGRRREP